MKKILTIVGAFGLSATTCSSVVACATETFSGKIISLADDHKSGTLDLNKKEAERLNLVVKNGEAYEKGVAWQPKVEATTTNGDLITAQLDSPDPATGRLKITLMAERPMNRSANITFKFERKTLLIKKLNLDWKVPEKQARLKKQLNWERQKN